MSNHIHLLLMVPDPEELPEEVSDAALVKMILPLFGAEGAKLLRLELANCDEHGFDEKKEKIRAGYLRRRGDLGFFMKNLKQRFTQHYNGKMGMRGTVWEARYKSVLVGNSDDALLTMAAYIDLN